MTAEVSAAVAALRATLAAQAERCLEAAEELREIESGLALLSNVERPSIETAARLLDDLALVLATTIDRVEAIATERL